MARKSKKIINHHPVFEGGTPALAVAAAESHEEGEIASSD